MSQIDPSIRLVQKVGAQIENHPQYMPGGLHHFPRYGNIRLLIQDIYRHERQSQIAQLGDQAI